jgi:hypothetical protein
MKIMIIACLAATTAFHSYCSGQTDTNLLAAGDWSEPVSDVIWPLRGRLLLCDAPARGNDLMWPEARVYLELQHVPDVPMASKLPIEIYTDEWSAGLQCEMRDGHDKLIARESIAYNGLLPAPVTVTLPPDSTLRLRADRGVRSPTPDGLLIWVSGGPWRIRPGDTNDYFLSGTFSPPTNQSPSVLKSHVWHGTLRLPSVKIPIDRIKKR